MGIRGIVCRDCPTSLMVIFDTEHITDKTVDDFYKAAHDKDRTEIRELNEAELELYDNLKKSLRAPQILL